MRETKKWEGVALDPDNKQIREDEQDFPHE